jgi:cytochrome c biogenesis protein
MSKDKKTDKVSFIDQIWNIFSSVKLAVIVFALISVTSIIGTIIEQQAESEKNIMVLKKLFGESAAPYIYNILDSLGFTDMYHSWWFVALLFIFAANLVICSVERLPKILKTVKELPSPLASEHFNSMPMRDEAVFEDDAVKVKDQTLSALKKAGFKTTVFEREGNTQIFAEKGRYSRLGVYITHLSLLTILVGAVVGIYFGFNGYLNLLEGEQSSVAYSRNENEIPLGFEIRCDDFDVSFYDKSDTPKSFLSILTIIENGKEVLTKTIGVNEPLRYKGITFYQSSYGFSPSMSSLFKFKIISKTGKTEDIAVRFGETFTIPDSSVKGTISDFSPALAIDKRGRLFTYTDSMNNPAVFIEFTDNGKAVYNQWILKRYPETWLMPAGTVEFKDLWGAQYTGLQVRKDPGVWLVYLGCLLMSIGLYIAFFMSHSRIWINLTHYKGKTNLSLAASTNKYKTALQRKIDKIIRRN